ncbi:helix-turn-helix transcriptional regulator [Pseudonocardia sp.]|uniref:helix-turn-helix domain-containing protein n=1 Tax=Pseudonocardia sp. TaxID=60912 RepID=UPI002F405290
MSDSPVLASWELGLRLRERRDAAGLTATVAAKQASCTQGYLSDVERGNTKIAPKKTGSPARGARVQQGRGRRTA